MKVLITGGAGYIGSILTSLCLEQGWEVSILDNLMYSANSLYRIEQDTETNLVTLPFVAPEDFSPQKFKFFCEDLRNTARIKEILAQEHYDAIVHLAAIVGVKSCQQNEAAAWDINCSASKKLIDLAREHSSRFIFASTYSVYGDQEGALVTETSPVKPQHVYESSKIAVEEYLASISNLPYTILRFATACGLSYRTRFDLLSNQLTVEAGKKKHIQVYQKDDLRSFVHVHDIARSIISVLSSPLNLVEQELFNVGECFLPESESYGSLTFSKEELAHVIQSSYAEQGTQVRTEFGAFTEDARNSVLIASKLRGQIGFIPQKTVRDSVDEIRDVLTGAAGVSIDPYDKEHYERSGEVLLLSD